jgi:hypothetical protein
MNYLEGVVGAVSSLEVGDAIAAGAFGVWNCDHKGPRLDKTAEKDWYVQTSLEGMKIYTASLLICEFPPTVSWIAWAIEPPLIYHLLKVAFQVAYL